MGWMCWLASFQQQFFCPGLADSTGDSFAFEPISVVAQLIIFPPFMYHSKEEHKVDSIDSVLHRQTLQFSDVEQSTFHV